jgi:hypothetical protein
MRSSRFTRPRCKRLADDILTAEIILGQGPIRLQDQLHGLSQIGASLVERGALGVGPGKLLDEADVPLRHLLKDSGELELHGDLLMSSQFTR